MRQQKANRISSNISDSARFAAGNIAGNIGHGSAIFALFLLIAFLFFVRLVWLQVIDAPNLRSMAETDRMSIMEIMPKRGTIYDRNGNVLATSVEAKTIYVNPEEVEDAKQTAEDLAALLGGSIQEYKDIIDKTSGTFAYIKRAVDVDIANKLKDKALSGIHFLPDTKRIYPYGEVAGQVIGFVNVDGEGISGLELYYNNILKGEPGREIAQYGRTGIPIPGAVKENVEPADGKDIMISLDITMQEHLEKSLRDGVSQVQGKNGNSLILDAATGEIYAMASTPLFNPSDLSHVEEGATDLKSVTQAFEPGSTFKAATMLAVLENGIYKPEDQLYCPAVLPADEYKVTDAHERGNETMTLTQILAKSSNVGTSLAASKLGFPELYNKIKEYKFNELTGIDSPGEAQGYLLDQAKWSKIQSYNVSFGQGIMVTPLQIARFYGAIDNNGVAVQPHFLMSFPQTKEVKEYPQETIIQNTQAIAPLTEMLEAVVENGTGKAAQIKGLKVAGKTGTAEYADEKGGYVKGSYNVSFVGFLPNSNSHLVCFVGASHVPGDRSVTAIFKNIMTYAVERYKIVAE